MNEKHKQGIGEEAENGFMSCLIALLVLIVIPTGAVMLLIWWFLNPNLQETVAEIEPFIQSSCNLPDYRANTESYDFIDGYYWDLIETENLVAFCYPSGEIWNCECFEAPN